YLLGGDDPQPGVQLGGAAGEHRRLPRAGGAGDDHRAAGPDRGLPEGGDRRVEHVAVDQLVEVPEDHPGELPDVDHHVAAAGDVLVDDVEPGAVVELGVLEPLGRVELPVGTRGVIDDLGQGAD